MVGDGGGGEEETEYESDPEEAKISLKLRRREASDDEDDVTEAPHRTASVSVDSDGESDGQGAAAVYDDGEEDDDEEEEYYDEEYEEEIDRDGGEGEVRVEKVVKEGLNEVIEVVGESQGEGKGEGEGEGEEEGKKKENEPFAVPTLGAFYMHDDRFRDNTSGGGRNRRTFGGRRLWESKDERKWGHDKFEEMNVQDRHYEEGRRSSKGYYQGRGRGRGRGTYRGRGRGTEQGRIRAYGGGSNNQNLAPKDVRGRGPKHYQLSMKNSNETLPIQNKQLTRSIDKTSNTGSGRNSASTANSSVKYEAIPARKVASILNYASPPFYPSGSSNKDMSQTQEELQAANHNRNFRPSVVDQSTCMPPANSLSRGKNAVDSISLSKLHIGDSVSPSSSKPLNNMRVASSLSSSSSVLPKFGTQSRGSALSGSTVLHTPEANNQVHKVPPPTAQASQRNPVQNQNEDSPQASVQQLAQHSLGASHGTSLKAGKGTAQGAGMGSLMYAGAQVMGSSGNTGAGRGDQNLPNFFPVMQFGSQHAGGIGVPAVGMAFPGYVAQPNGLGNSEMTWLPVLASAAGAMGATYCPPYMAVDGTYQPHPAEQTAALPAPSKDNNLAKSNNGVKPLQKPVSNDELSQRQNKPRRYSEMKFSQ